MGSINATFLGGFILVLAFIMGSLGYYLGKRKTQTPALTAILAVFTAFIPPIAFIFLIVLVLKKDVPQRKER